MTILQVRCWSSGREQNQENLLEHFLFCLQSSVRKSKKISTSFDMNKIFHFCSLEEEYMSYKRTQNVTAEDVKPQ